MAETTDPNRPNFHKAETTRDETTNHDSKRLGFYFPQCTFVYQRNKMEDKDEDGSPVKQIKYVRPSDRSPEKDFHTRNEESKINSCLLRSSVQQARQKLNLLRDELEERCKFSPVIILIIVQYFYAAYAHLKIPSILGLHPPPTSHHTHLYPNPASNHLNLKLN